MPRDCDDNNRCTVDSCDIKLGCLHKPFDCVSGYLNSPAHNSDRPLFACLNITCDPKVGCTTTVKNCDDQNACTTDSCNPKTGTCIHTPVLCVQDETDMVNISLNKKLFINFHINDN